MVKKILVWKKVMIYFCQYQDLKNYGKPFYYMDSLKNAFQLIFYQIIDINSFISFHFILFNSSIQIK